MRKAELKVPINLMVLFCIKMMDYSLTNEIVGVSDEEEFTIEVTYHKQEASDIDALEAYLKNGCKERGNLNWRDGLIKNRKEQNKK
jgi:hypothetical protein